MHLFSYLYVVVVLIPLQQIKVMKLKVYLLLQKLEIPFRYRTDSSLETDMIPIQDFNGIITGTGTTGDTTIIGDSTLEVGTILIGVFILIIGIIAHLADRWLNQKQGFVLTDLEDQNQE